MNTQGFVKQFTNTSPIRYQQPDSEQFQILISDSSLLYMLLLYFETYSLLFSFKYHFHIYIYQIVGKIFPAFVVTSTGSDLVKAVDCSIYGACLQRSKPISKEQTQIQALENVESVAAEYVCLIVWETLPQWQSHRFLDKGTT